MGQGWRRVSEAVLQKTGGIANRNFKATSNLRNELMFKEASNFARSILLLEKDLKSMTKCIESHFRNLRGILISPVPRIYDTQNDVTAPLEDEVRMLGANMDVEAIPKAADDAKKRVHQEVMEPLLEWLSAYRVISDRMQSLEQLRLELDSRRRTVTNLQVKLEKLRTEQTGRDRAKLQLEVKETEDIMARKEDKMTRTWAQFSELERTVYNSLYTLVRDTAVLRDYTHAALTIIQECFQTAAQAYNQAPNPQFSSNNALAYTSGNEACAAGGDRLTPRGVVAGIKELFRGGKNKVPESPVMRDASDQHDQVPYMPPPAYAHQRQQQVPQMYMQRRTNDMEVPPPGNYVQPAAPTSGGYMGMASPHRYTQMPYNQQPQMMHAGPTGWTQDGY